MKHTVNEIALKNGSKGLLIDIPGATVMTIDFCFRAGEYLVKRDKWETPHIMEHMALGANKLIPKARAFQAEFEKNGAYGNASTSVYTIGYEAECADFEWDRILELMLIAISKPLFLQEEFDAEVGNIRDELTGRSNNHFRHLSIAMREAYGFLGMTDEERLEKIDNVSLDDIRRHYKKTHITQNMRFIIAGNLHGRKAQIARMIEGIELPEGDGLFELPDETPVNPGQVVFIPNESIKNIYFYLDSYALTRFENPDWDALQLVNTILTETLHSRMLGEARERGLVYSMGSGLNYTKNNSAWWFGAQVMSKNARALFEIIHKELMRVRSGDISDDDIDAAKQYLLGRYQRSGQTVGGTAEGYSGRYYFDLEVDDYFAIPERIKAINRKRIIDSTERMFSDKLGGIGVLGGTNGKLAEDLHEYIQQLWS